MMFVCVCVCEQESFFIVAPSFTSFIETGTGTVINTMTRATHFFSITLFYPCRYSNLYAIHSTVKIGLI